MAGSVRKILILGGIGLVLLTVTLVIIPRFLNPDYLKSLALQQIQRTFGPHVTVGPTTLTLFPQPSLSITDIVVKERPESHAVFRAQAMNLELEIGQLLQKKIVVREFVLDHPEIEIHRDTAGEWRFLGRTHGESLLPPLANFLVMGTLRVEKGKIIVIDESPHEAVRGIVVEEVRCVTDTSFADKAVKATVELSGALRQNQSHASFEIQGKFDGLLFPPMDQQTAQASLFEQLNFQGNLTARRLEVGQLSEYIPYGNTLSGFPESVDVAMQIKWKQEGTRSLLHLTDLSVVSDTLNITGNANYEDLEDGHQMMGAALKSSKLDLALLRTYVPNTLIPEDLQMAWEQGQWGGILEVSEARITGSSRPDVGTSIAGTFQVQDGFADIPGWKPAKHIEGTLVVEPDRIQLKNAHGVYDSIPLEVVQGVLLFKEEGPWGDIELQGPVPAEKVWDFIRELRPPKQRLSFLNTWKIRAGGGTLRLRFSGNVKEREGLRFQFGEFHPQNLAFSLPEVPHEIMHGQGKILFSRHSTVLEGIQGIYDQYPFSIDGAISYQEEPSFEALKITGMFEGKDLWGIEASQKTGGHGIGLHGPLGLSVILSGPAAHPKIKGTLETRNGTIHVPPLFHKEAGQEGILEFEGQFQPNGRVRLHRMEFILLPIRIRSQGTLQFGPAWGFDGRIDSGPVYIGLLPEGVTVLGDYLQSGILEIQLGVRGRGDDWRKWQTRGWVALTEGVGKVPGVPTLLNNIFLRLKVQGERLEVKRAEFRMLESEAVITGIVEHWKDMPAASLMMEAPRFDLDLLIPKKERSAIRDGIEWLAAHGTLQGSIHVEHPAYKNFHGKKLSAEMKIHDNLVSVDKIQLMVEQIGTLDGRLFVHLPEGKPGAVRASFQGRDLPFEKFLALFGDDRRLISGDLSIRGMIQGHGRDSRGILPTLSGNLEASIRQGYVRRGTILPRILAILNLPYVLQGKEDFEAKGFPFEKVNATIKIAEGEFSTKDLYIDSSIMKITAAGSYQAHYDRLDAVAAVSPFGAYSDLLKSIPLFGRIFTGERKGIDTAMFSIVGALGEPKITYLPVESFTTGITGLAQLAFDILKNTITMPYDLLNGGQKKSPQPAKEIGRPGSSPPP